MFVSLNSTYNPWCWLLEKISHIFPQNKYFQFDTFLIVFMLAYTIEYSIEGWLQKWGGEHGAPQISLDRHTLNQLPLMQNLTP